MPAASRCVPKVRRLHPHVTEKPNDLSCTHRDPLGQRDDVHGMSASAWSPYCGRAIYLTAERPQAPDVEVSDERGPESVTVHRGYLLTSPTALVRPGWCRGARWDALYCGCPAS